jgi:hypothetical protein
MAEDLVSNGALAGDDERIVEGMDEPQAARQDDLIAVRLGIGIRVAAQHDFRAHLADRVDLDLRRRLRHHDEGAQAQVARREGHALRVVARAGRNDAPRALRLGEVRDVVVGAAQLEAENRLQVFPFQEHLVLQARREARRRLERRLVRDVVDTARQNQPEHRVGIDAEIAGGGHDQRAASE